MADKSQGQDRGSRPGRDARSSSGQGSLGNSGLQYWRLRLWEENKKSRVGRFKLRRQEEREEGPRVKEPRMRRRTWCSWARQHVQARLRGPEGAAGPPRAASSSVKQASGGATLDKHHITLRWPWRNRQSPFRGNFRTFL